MIGVHVGKIARRDVVLRQPYFENLLQFFFPASFGYSAL